MPVFILKWLFKRNVSVQYTRCIYTRSDSSVFCLLSQFGIKSKLQKGIRAITLYRFRYFQFANLTSAKHLLLLYMYSANEESSPLHIVLKTNYYVLFIRFLWYWLETFILWISLYTVSPILRNNQHKKELQVISTNRYLWSLQQEQDNLHHFALFPSDLFDLFARRFVVVDNWHINLVQIYMVAW